MQKASHYIESLQLTAHPEGGAYREVYRSDLTLTKDTLTPAHNGDRNAMTSIYFLLRSVEFSALHRIASDELWHHLDGGTLHVYEITTAGELVVHKLGKHLAEGEKPLICVKAGSWFGSRVEVADSYCLCSCTVSPGFDFADFEMGKRDTLLTLYPKFEKNIRELTLL